MIDQGGADPDVVDQYGESCLTLAASMGNVDVLLLLLERSKELWSAEAKEKVRRRRGRGREERGESDVLLNMHHTRTKEKKDTEGEERVLVLRREKVCVGGRRQWYTNLKNERERITVVYTVEVVTFVMMNKKKGEVSIEKGEIEVVVTAKYGLSLTTPSIERRFTPRELSSMGLCSLLLSLDMSSIEEEKKNEEAEEKEKEEAEERERENNEEEEEISDEDEKDKEQDNEQDKEQDKEHEQEMTSMVVQLTTETKTDNTLITSPSSSKNSRRPLTQYEIDAEYHQKQKEKREQWGVEQRMKRRRRKVQNAGKCCEEY